ncbi:MAG: hypothetical protein M1821_008269 [Bathelium mastoideum]|nr:MAG: hypothetical protein M1821_008269 [Bathelium mastoideum]
MSQHNALLLTALKTPLTPGKRTTPAPKSGEVLVKVEAAGLNPHDSKGVEWGLFTTDYLPAAVLASDLAGTVVQLGPDVTKYQVGDHILGQSGFVTPGALPDQAGLQKYAILEAAHTAPIPQSLGFDAATTLPVPFVAAYVALFHPKQLGLAPPIPSHGSRPDYSGETILIVGGGSQCGRAAIQLARLVGVGTIITVAGANPASTARLRALGATHVVDRHASDAEIEAGVRAVVGDELVYALDVVSEASGGDPTAPSAGLALACLSRRRRGKLATLLPGGLDEEVARTKEAGVQKTFASGMSHLHPELMKPFWEHLPEWVEQGVIKPGDFEVVEGLDPERVNELLDGYRDGKVFPKPSIRPWGKTAS